MPTEQPAVLSPAEAMQRAIEAAKFIVYRRGDLEVRRQEALEEALSGTEGHEERIKKLNDIEIQVNYADVAIEAHRNVLEGLGVKVAAHLQALSDELRGLHEQAAELVRDYVYQRTKKAMGGQAWWTQAQISSLAATALPMREWHRFEVEHPSNIRTDFAYVRDEKTGNTLNTLHDSTINDPSRLPSDYARLIENIDATKQRIAAMKRDFAANR